MNNFDLRTARFISILVGICLLFLLVVWNAYKYLPENNTSSRQISESKQINVSSMNEQSENLAVSEPEYSEEDYVEEEGASEEEEVLEETAPEQAEENISQPSNTAKFVEVNENELNSQADYNEVYKSADEYRTNKDYPNAISMYEKAAEITSNKDEKALCYENIAEIYAIMKRYGTALAFSQKSYNLEPTTKREILLARLYYKTGDIEKSSQRVNNILQRDFAADKF